MPTKLIEAIIGDIDNCEDQLVSEIVTDLFERRLIGMANTF